MEAVVATCCIPDRAKFQNIKSDLEVHVFFSSNDHDPKISIIDM